MKYIHMPFMQNRCEYLINPNSHTWFSQSPITGNYFFMRRIYTLSRTYEPI